MKKYIVIMATVVLLLLVFAPATYAQEGYGGYGGGYGGGWQNCQGTCYQVRYGDNLYRIGLRFGVSYWEIARANNLQNPNWIYAGQWLYIPPSQCCQQMHHPYPSPYYGGNPVGYYGGGYNDGYGGDHNHGYGGY